VRHLFAILLFFLFVHDSSAQEVKRFKVNKVRILFLLDASGSMVDNWTGKKRMDIAKTVLLDIADSLEKKYPEVYFGLRVFGSEFPREKKNCKDTKLAMPFAQKSRENLKKTLSKLVPRGMTPIAYSLEQAAKDFGKDSNCINAIVLLTDGDENCSGDPCKAADFLVKNKISFRPYIVGLGVQDKTAAKFDCVGKFINASDEKSLRETVSVLVRQTMRTTSAQVNLIDHNGNANITNIPFTMYDSESGAQEYNFIHTLNPSSKLSDTLFLNPLGRYKLVVHSIPPVVKDNIELSVGQHNIIAVNMPVGTLTAKCPGATFLNNEAQVVVRNNKGKIVHVQDLNTSLQYLKSYYTVDMLTKPPSREGAMIDEGSSVEKKIEQVGTVTLYATESTRVSILADKDDSWVEIEDFITAKKYESLKLQPGIYRLVYQKISSRESKDTKLKRFIVESGRSLNYNLD
jgi:Ca-activated chloride channel homolog